MTDWYVGQKIVCVNARDFMHPERFPVLPVEGGVYTIREIDEWPLGDLGLRVEEITGAFCSLLCIEHGFWPWRFRSVVTPEADISIFTEILDRLNERSVETV